MAHYEHTVEIARTIETRGATSRLGGPLVARATRGELKANCGRLKELLEGGG